MTEKRLGKRFLVLGVLAIGCSGSIVLAQDQERDPQPTPHVIPLREFTPEMVQQALDGIEARQKQFYEGLVAKGRHKGVLTVLGSALGRYGLNKDVDKANQMMEERYLKAYEEARENARGPWYSFAREARMYYLFGSRSAHHPGRMSPAVEKILLEHMWQWASTTARKEFTLPERDWWSLGSENHWFSLWTGMCVTANIFAEHPDYKDRKYADGTAVPEMAKAFNERFKRLCRDRASKGLFVECASHYNKLTLSGVMNIADFSPDPVLKNRVRMLLDLYWADWAIEQIDGIRGGSRSRSYNDPISTTGSSMGPAAWILFGVNEGPSFGPEFWTTGTTLYRPHPLVVELVLDAQGRGAYASVTRRPGKREPGTIDQELHYVSEPKDHILNLDKMQVLDDDCGGLLRYTWCTPDFIMGSWNNEAQPNDYWVNFSSQNRWDGVIFGGHSTARIYCQPVGQLQAGRGSFFNANWAVQSKGVQVIQRLRDDFSEGADNDRVWFDDSLERVERSGWVFAKAQRAYAAVRVVDGEVEWKEDTGFRPAKGEKPGPGKWLFCKNEFTPVIIEVAQQKDYPSFNAFQEQILSNPLKWENKKLDYQSIGYKTKLTFFADYSQPPQVDGIPVNYSPAKMYDSPYIQGDFGSGVVTLKNGDRQVVLDFNKE